MSNTLTPAERIKIRVQYILDNWDLWNTRELVVKTRLPKIVEQHIGEENFIRIGRTYRFKTDEHYIFAKLSGEEKI